MKTNILQKICTNKTKQLTVNEADNKTKGKFIASRCTDRQYRQTSEVNKLDRERENLKSEMLKKDMCSFN